MNEMETRYPLSCALPGVKRTLLSHCRDVDCLEHLCVKNLVRCLSDTSLFIKNLSALREKPYTRELFGESEKDCLAVREALAGYIGFEDKDDKYSFAAWSLWQQRRDKVYLGSNVIFAYCGSHHLDSKELMRFLHAHPEKKNFYTYVDLHFHEQNVQRWIQRASWLGCTGRDTPALDATQCAALKHVIAR